MIADLDFIPQIVTEDMNDILTGEFQAWEVKATLKQMAPLKDPGPNGMPHLFYHNLWDLVKGDVINTILNFLNSGFLPNPLNHIFITLIPKTKNLESVTEFRPISLCNVLYKFFFKSISKQIEESVTPYHFQTSKCLFEGSLDH